MADNNFIDGLIVKAPHPNAPDFVKAKLSIKREELISWLQQQSGEWINADIKESRAGKWYAAIDNWKPDSERRNDNTSSDNSSNNSSNSTSNNNSMPPQNAVGDEPWQDNPPPQEDFNDDIPF